jgi:hypothetical protein
MKTALLVFGPESSGTRFVTRALVAMGAEGDDTHAQRYDGRPVHLLPGDASLLDERSLDQAGEILVWRRSFPHGVRSARDDHRWPRVAEILTTLLRRGFSPHVVVTVRDQHCVVESQVRRFGIAREEARANIRRAYREIYLGMATGHHAIPSTVCCFESLILHGTDALAHLGRELGLPGEIGSGFPIRDSDGAYFRTTKP